MQKLLSIFTVCAFMYATASSLKAADKFPMFLSDVDEQNVKEVGVAFLKAMKSRDVGKMLLQSQTPFLLDPFVVKRGLGVHQFRQTWLIVEKAEELKTAIKTLN